MPEPQGQNPHLHIYGIHNIRQQRNCMMRPAAQGGQGLSRAPSQLPYPARCSLGQCDVVLIEVILQQHMSREAESN